MLAGYLTSMATTNATAASIASAMAVLAGRWQCCWCCWGLPYLVGLGTSIEANLNVLAYIAAAAAAAAIMITIFCGM